MKHYELDDLYRGKHISEIGPVEEWEGENAVIDDSGTIIDLIPDDILEVPTVKPRFIPEPPGKYPISVIKRRTEA